MLTVLTWWWGDKYPISYVERLQRGFRSHLKEPHRFVCVTTKAVNTIKFETWPILDPELTQVRGCFARLRMFDPAWQAERGLIGRIVCVDLDCVVTGRLDPLFNRPDSFVIFGGANAANPCPFNGSLMMLRAGSHPEVWEAFSLDAAQRVPFHEFPDDQGWIWHMMPGAAVWRAGPASGAYAFQKPGWPVGHSLPPGARIVFFPGKRDPGNYRYLSWIKEHWR